MKKLIQSTMPVLFLLSLIFSACDKPEVKNPNPVNPNGAVFWINYKWTNSKGEAKSGSKEITDGEKGKVIHLDPYLHGSGICCDGTWGYTVEFGNKVYGSTQDPKTGEVTFIPGSPGTYKITITYTCPDGTKYSASITITVV